MKFYSEQHEETGSGKPVSLNNTNTPQKPDPELTVDFPEDPENADGSDRGAAFFSFSAGMKPSDESEPDFIIYDLPDYDEPSAADIPEETGEQNVLKERAEPEEMPQERAEPEEMPQEQAEPEEMPQAQAESEDLPQAQAESEEMPRKQAESEDLPQAQPESKDLPRKKERRRSSFANGVFVGVLVTLSVIVIGGFTGAYLVGRMLTGSGSSSASDAAAESADAQEPTLSNVLDEEALEKIEALLALLDYYYYQDISVSDLQEGIYDGLVAGIGDDYTEYYTAQEQEDVSVDTSGTYSGIGAVITVDSDTDWPMISYTYEGSPAEEAGLKTGDLIIQVDETEVTSETSTSDVASMIRGEAGTSVHVIVLRDSQEVEMDIIRADIDTPSVTYQMIDEKIGYLYILQFSSNTEEQFAEAYDALCAEGMEALIIDLRYNGGGTVSSCVEILDDILPAGVTLTMVAANGDVTEYTSDDDCIDLPIALLVNGSTASASEIVTAALMDYDYATVIGTTTYGKGVYQQSWELTDGSGIKITVGMFYSPNGNNYNGVGIEPDIVLEYENTAGEDADYSVDTDNQIQCAVEVLEEALRAAE